MYNLRFHSVLFHFDRNRQGLHCTRRAHIRTRATRLHKGLGYKCPSRRPEAHRGVYAHSRPTDMRSLLYPARTFVDTFPRHKPSLWHQDTQNPRFLRRNYSFLYPRHIPVHRVRCYRRGFRRLRKEARRRRQRTHSHLCQVDRSIHCVLHRGNRSKATRRKRQRTATSRATYYACTAARFVQGPT